MDRREFLELLEDLKQIDTMEIQDRMPLFRMKDSNFVDLIPDYDAHGEELTMEAEISLAGIRRCAAWFKTPDDVKKQILYPILLVRALSKSTHFSKRNGWHCYQLFYTHAGRGIMNFENRMYTLEPGSILLVDCLPYQYYYAASEEGWDYTAIHFAGGNAPYLYEKVKENGLLYEAMDNTPVARKVMSLLDLADADPEDYDLQFHEAMTSVLVELSVRDNPQKSYTDVPGWLGEVQGYIAEHYAEPLRVADLAAMSYLSESQFSHRFKEFIGEAPISYQQRLRILHAKELLETTEDPVDSIGSRVGFPTEANFFAAFKRNTGMTPGKYRRQKKQI